MPPAASYTFPITALAILDQRLSRINWRRNAAEPDWPMTSDQAEAYRRASFAAIIILIVQFLLGMAVNLFVVIPKDHPGSNPPEYFSGVFQSVTWAILHGHLFLVLHAVLGLLLVLNGVGLLVRAIQLRLRSLLLTAGFG